MISVQDLEIRVGDFHLNGVNFEIPEKKYGVLMGRTGTGKTTLLEAVCGLRSITKGKVFLMGEEVTDRPISNRGIGFVPQDLALFPTKTVKQHLSFGPKNYQWSTESINQKVDYLCERLKLKHVVDHYPKQLSGGEKQRVALGRALAIEPKILCLDEPLSALDESTKEEMVSLLNIMKNEESVTVLHITHSQTEAEQLGDLILSMEELIQSGG